jgi:hypothetical protein
MHTYALEEEVDERNSLIETLKLMQKPFGFVTSYYVQEIVLDKGVDTNYEERMKGMQDNALKQEKVLLAKFDAFTS